MSESFDRLHPLLRHHIVNSLAWRDLRPVQEESIRATLDGRNTIVLAPTAGGKTEAAFFPLISRVLTEDWRGVSVLYLSPIKALLNNQEHRLRRYYDLVGRRIALWHGDSTASARKAILREPPDCLLTTPESLEVMLVSAKVQHRRFLGDVRAIVVDEVHAFAGDDRGWHLLSLLARVSALAGRDIQRLGLSATVGNPDFLVEWLSAGSAREREVIRPLAEDEARPRVELDHVGSLPNAARVISALHRGEKRLVFVDSRARVESLASLLRDSGTRTFVSHSSLGVDERRQAEHAFASGQDCVIVATSALELGIDVGDLDRVIQIDAPGTVSSFLQRMGRTGRRPGAERNCLFLATSDDALMHAAAIIELWRSGHVEPIEPPPNPLHILAQQLMALVLEERGIGVREWFERVRVVPAFAALDENRVARVVGGMLARGILREEEGILSLGERGEAEFGRKNFLELFSVFSAPPLFAVRHGRQDLGFVHQSSFLARQQGPLVLLLGGRSWRVRAIDWARRIAQVETTDERGRSRWRGQGQMLGRALCRAIRAELTGTGERPYWTERATRRFAEIRSTWTWLEAEGTTLVAAGERDSDSEWWTFAGGKANATLANELGRALGAEVSPTSFSVRIKKAPSAAAIARAIDGLAERPAGELIPEIDERAIEGLKFRECLDDSVAIEILAKRLSDSEGVVEALRERRTLVRRGE